MEVLDRYLQAVRSWLPRGQQDDIVAELSDDLRAQVEEAEAERGRPLEEAEVEALLKRRGHPLWVAEAYLPDQPLIGPALLPAYRLALKIAIGGELAVFAAVYVLLGLVFEVRGFPSSLGHWAWQACLYGFATGGLITLVFSRLERSQRRARALGEWDPRRPQELPGLARDPRVALLLRRRVSAVVEVLTSGLFALAWVGVARLPSIAPVVVGLTPAWAPFYWPILGLALADVGVNAATLVRPERSRLLYGVGLARASYALVLLARLLWAGPAVAIAVPGLPADAAAGFNALANFSIWITLLFIVPFYAALGVRDARGVLGMEPTRHRAVRFFAGE